MVLGFLQLTHKDMFVCYGNRASAFLRLGEFINFHDSHGSTTCCSDRHGIVLPFSCTLDSDAVFSLWLVRAAPGGAAGCREIPSNG